MEKHLEKLSKTAGERGFELLTLVLETSVLPIKLLSLGGNLGSATQVGEKRIRTFAYRA
jgi:hypothetical protein